MPVRRNVRGLLVEAVLLSPVIGLLTLAGLEIRHACDVHSRVTAAARQLAETAGDGTGPSAIDHLAINANLNAAAIRIGDSPEGRTIAVTVPYRHAGGPLASFWATENVVGISRLSR